MTTLAIEPVAETFEQRIQRLKPQETFTDRLTRIRRETKRFEEKMLYPQSPEAFHGPLAEDFKKHLPTELVTQIGGLPGGMRGAFYKAAKGVIFGGEEGVEVGLVEGGKSVLPPEKRATLEPTWTHLTDAWADEVAHLENLGPYEETLRPYLRALAGYAKRVRQARADAEYETRAMKGRIARRRMQNRREQQEIDLAAAAWREEYKGLLKPMAAADGFVGVLQQTLVGFGLEGLRDTGPVSREDRILRKALEPEVVARTVGGLAGIAATLKVAPGAAGRVLAGAALGRGEALEAGADPELGALIGGATFGAFEVGRFAVARFRNIRGLGKRFKIPYGDAKKVYAAAKAGESANAGQALHDAYMKQMVPRVDQKAARAIDKLLKEGDRIARLGAKRGVRELGKEARLDKQAARIYQGIRARAETKGLYAQLGIRADATPEQIDLAFQQIAKISGVKGMPPTAAEAAKYQAEAQILKTGTPAEKTAIRELQAARRAVPKLTLSEAMKARSAYEVLRNPDLRAKYDAGTLTPADWRLRVEAAPASPAALRRPQLAAKGRALLPAKVAAPREAVPVRVPKPAPKLPAKVAAKAVAPKPKPIGREAELGEMAYRPLLTLAKGLKAFEGSPAALSKHDLIQAVLAAEAPTPAPPAPEAKPAPVKVKFMLTQADRAALEAKGYTEARIQKLTPQAAQRIIEGRQPIAKMPRAELLAELKGRGIYHKAGWKRQWLAEALEGKREPISPAAVPNKGLREFLADESGALDVDKAGQALGKVQRGFLRVVEPAKIVERKLGAAVYAQVIKAMHLPEKTGLWWDMHRIAEGGDQVLAAIGERLGKYPAADLENLMLARGTPGTSEGHGLQREALKQLPKELRPYLKTLQSIADLNYRLAQRVDPDLNYVEDYFYGVYEDAPKTKRFLEHYKTTQRWRKHKQFPTYADARAWGLKLRDKNPVDNLRREVMHIARLAGLINLRGDFLRSGLGKYIVLEKNATIAQRNNWTQIEDPIFKEYLLDPDLARLVNNLIEANKVSRSKPLRALRAVNNTLRSIKFIGSAFHMMTVAKQTVADVGPMGIFMPWRTGKAFWQARPWSGFKKYDPIFKTPEYRQYIGLGGGHTYSIASQAQRSLERLLTSPDMNALWRLARLPLRAVTKPLRAFIKHLFQHYIPAIKYAKYLETMERAMKKLGRPLSDAELITIIKEGQNFFGMMNEREFGRSATTTSLLRFMFMAPGFAEGNYRTMAKALLHWRRGGPTGGARRSRWNIPQSLFLTGLAGTIGTLIMTGKLPDPPENADEFRDLFKVKTPWKDDRDRTIYVDLLTYDKDYWEQVVLPGWKLCTGHPIEAAEHGLTKFVKRIGGMKATGLGVAADLYKLSTGEALVDWKGQRIFYITDPALVKLRKLGVHWLDRAQPISASVAQRMMKKGVHPIFAFTAAAVGLRPAYSERDKKVNELCRNVWALRENQEELYYRLAQLNSPRDAIKEYNAIVDRITAHPLMTDELAADLKLKKRPLRIDVVRLTENKVYAFSGPSRDAEAQKKDIRWLKNFGIGREEAKRLVRPHFKRTPLKKPWKWEEREKAITDRIRRIGERWPVDEAKVRHAAGG